MVLEPIPSPSWRSAPANSAPGTPLRRPASARAPPSSRGRRPAASPTASSSSERRTPRPAWNGYLTDDTQYRLTHEERLLKQMQQLSAAHFHGRTSPVVRRDEGEESWSRESHASYAAPSLRRRHINLRDEDDGFSEDQQPDSRCKIRNELSALERMLSELEHETERLEPSRTSHYADDDDEDKVDANAEIYRDQRSEKYAPLGVVEEEEKHDNEEVLDTTELDDPVASICFKSLQLGIDLTQKVQTLARKLESERRYRKQQDRRIRELEQHCDELQERSDESEARYQDLYQQVDAMRDAMIATGEALHRIRQDLFHPREDTVESPPPPEAPRDRPPFQPKNVQRVSPHRRFRLNDDKENYFEQR